MTEVKLLVVHPGEPEEVNGDGPVIKSANIIGVAYDTAKPPAEGGRRLETHEMPEDLGDFVSEVLESLSPMLQGWVIEWAEAMRKDPSLGEQQVFTQILVGFLSKPIELVGNALAALLTECATQLAEGDDSESTIAEMRKQIAADDKLK